MKCSSVNLISHLYNLDIKKTFEHGIVSVGIWNENFVHFAHENCKTIGRPQH